MKKFLLWSFILFMIVGGLAASFYGWRNVSRSLASKDWPSVEGKIIDSRVEEQKVKEQVRGQTKLRLIKRGISPKLITLIR